MRHSIGVFTVIGLMAALGLSACRSGEQPIAKVNETPLSREEYYRRLEIAPTPVPIGQGQITTAPAGYTTLMQMIREQVLLQMARERGVMPTDKQVDERVDREMKNNPQIKQAITELKVMTLDDFRRQVRVALAEFNLITRGVTVTEQEMKQFYEQNKRAFYRPTSVRARFVLVQNPEIRRQIDDDLKRGFSFHSIVQKYSQNPAAGIQAGETDIPIEGPINARTQQEAEQAQRLRQVLQNAKVGQVTDWIQFGDVAARVEVITRTSGRQQTYEEVKETIREGLMLQEGREKNKDINAELARAVLNAKVEILSPQWKERYQRDMEQLRKALEEYEKQQKQASGRP
ncbi:MAG: peptidyl-prolyl cis-trans isomerase [Armatimonadota bacterium]